MPTYPTLRRLAMLAVVLTAASGCASKYAKFRDVHVAERDAKAAFAKTETVLTRYFSHMESRKPEQGLLSTEKGYVTFGELPKDQFRIYATAVVVPAADGCRVKLKVQRTQIKGRWTWLGLGLNFYEKEVIAGTDEPLAKKIAKDLVAEMGAPAAPAPVKPEPVKPAPADAAPKK